MGKYLIANFVTEITPKYDKLTSLLMPFEYKGSREADIKLSVSNERIRSLRATMVSGSSLAQAEELLCSNVFGKTVIKYNALLIHSSALVYEGKAYLFSAESGVGKSTHTRLWKQAFGDAVNIINDDKPVVRVQNNLCTAYGTPFDGGSNIAKNQSAPLKAIIFIERGEDNSIRRATQKEIIKNLYLATTYHIDKEDAFTMLENFELLIKHCEFYILKCNTDISAAYTAFNTLIND